MRTNHGITFTYPASMVFHRFIGYIEDIFFFEVNTKYTSSNALKMSVISRVRSTNEIADILNARDEIFLVFTEKKVNFLLFKKLKGKSLTLS